MAQILLDSFHPWTHLREREIEIEIERERERERERENARGDEGQTISKENVRLKVLGTVLTGKLRTPCLTFTHCLFTV